MCHAVVLDESPRVKCGRVHVFLYNVWLSCHDDPPAMDGLLTVVMKVYCDT